jgi:hypothetical protein
VPLLAKIFGVLLALLGIVLYANATPNEETGRKSITALIPAFWGIALVALGQIAENPKARMHAMHGAALLGVLGAVIPLVMPSPLWSVGDFELLKHGGRLAMAILCAVFTGLCVKSFIDARRRRRQSEPGQQS